MLRERGRDWALKSPKGEAFLTLRSQVTHAWLEKNKPSMVVVFRSAWSFWHRWGSVA